MRRADWIEFAKYGVQRKMILNTAIKRVFFKKQKARMSLPAKELQDSQ